MSHDIFEVEILGKTYQMKCPANEAYALERAAAYLNAQMQSIREKHEVVSTDKVLVTAALNIAHQLFVLEHKTLEEEQQLQARLNSLQDKIDSALPTSIFMDYKPAE